MKGQNQKLADDTLAAKGLALSGCASASLSWVRTVS